MRALRVFAALSFVAVSAQSALVESNFYPNDQQVQCSRLDKDLIMLAITSTQDLPGTERVLAISDFFLGQGAFWKQAEEYSESNPLSTPKKETLTINLNKLNCVNYQEIVIAASRSSNWEEFLDHLAFVRYYDGAPSTAGRHHFASVDWIPQNIENGYVRDITHLVANSFDPGSLVSPPEIVVDREAFISTFYREYLPEFQELFEEEKRRTSVSLNYIDFDHMWTPSQASATEIASVEEEELSLFSQIQDLLEENESASEEQANANWTQIKQLRSKLNKMRLQLRLNGATLRQDFIDALPAISIASLVKPGYQIRNKAGELVTDMFVSHHGFVVKKDGKLFFRHTSTKRAEKVEDIPFEDYIGNYLVSGSNTDHPHNRRSKWRGLHFLAIETE